MPQFEVERRYLVLLFLGTVHSLGLACIIVFVDDGLRKAKWTKAAYSMIDNADFL